MNDNKKLLNIPQATEPSNNNISKAKYKKHVIVCLVCIVILCYIIKVYSISGIALVAGLVACVWLIFCTVKGKKKKFPAIITIILFTIAFAVPDANRENITQKQLIDNLSDVMQPVGYQLIPTDNMSDNSYYIYVKDRPNDTPRPNGILCMITEENGYVKSITLTSANGSKGIPMSAMKFVSALNPKWSSGKVTKVMTGVLKGENVHDNGITYSFEDYGTSSRFLIELK